MLFNIRRNGKSIFNLLYNNVLHVRTVCIFGRAPFFSSHSRASSEQGPGPAVFIFGPAPIFIRTFLPFFRGSRREVHRRRTMLLAFPPKDDLFTAAISLTPKDGATLLLWKHLR